MTHSNFLECGTKIVLAGYSQGAQVIGEALTDYRLRNYLPQISFVATFGDPSLDMNTIFGGNISGDTPWYRGDALKYISGGLVNVRNPYMPRSLANKTGAWCDQNDMICTGNLLKVFNERINKPHSNYHASAIPAAAKEIVSRLKVDLAQPFTGPECGASRQDIVLAINTSPSMLTDSVFLSDEGIAKTVKDAFTSGCDVRVGMVEFGRLGVDSVRPVMDFTDSPVDLATTLESYRTNQAPDHSIYRADVVGGISTALDFTWREGAQKAVIVISDAGGDRYGLDATQSYNDSFLRQPIISDIIRGSRERGGVEIYAVSLDHDPAQPFVYAEPEAVDFYGYMQSLVVTTSGHFGDSGCTSSYCTWLNRGSSFQTRMGDKPYVNVAPVRLKVGDSVEVVAQDVYGNTRDGSWNYKWYVDCEDPINNQREGSSIVLRPQTAGNCTGSVEASQGIGYCYRGCYEGGVMKRATTTFPIEILPADYAPPALPGSIRNVTKEYLAAEKILRIQWEAPTNAAQVGEIAYVIKDSDGSILGVTTAKKLHITEVEPSDIPVVTVSTASASGVGPATSSDNAQDITPDTAEADRSAVLSSSDIQQLQSTPADIPGVVARVSTSTTSARPSTITDTLAPDFSSVASLTNLFSKEPATDDASAKRPSWLSLTIVAVPLALMVALGVAVKYGLLLRLKG